MSVIGAGRGASCAGCAGKCSIGFGELARWGLDFLRAVSRTGSLSSVFLENIADDFFCYRLLRCEEQIVDDCICDVSHGQRVRNEGEASNLFQSFSKGGDDFVIALLDDIAPVQPSLGAFRVCSLLPRVVSPELGHPFNAAGWNFFEVFPNSVPIHIHDGKVQEHIDRLGLTGLQHYFPIEMQAIWIQETQGAVVISILNLRQQFLCQDVVAIAGADMNVAPVSAKRAKVIGLLRIKVYKIVSIEWRGDFQSPRRTAFNYGAGCLLDVSARPAETVNVVFFQAVRLFEGIGVSSTIFSHDLQLQLRPDADLVKFKRTVSHALIICNSCCWVTLGSSLGNWFHSRPSSSLPPALGERPPHCLKKKATFTFRH